MKAFATRQKPQHGPSPTHLLPSRALICIKSSPRRWWWISEHRQCSGVHSFHLVPSPSERNLPLEDSVFVNLKPCTSCEASVGLGDDETSPPGWGGEWWSINASFWRSWGVMKHERQILKKFTFWSSLRHWLWKTPRNFTNCTMTIFSAGCRSIEVDAWWLLSEISGAWAQNACTIFLENICNIYINC